jgi:hypothetical protein
MGRTFLTSKAGGKSVVTKSIEDLPGYTALESDDITPSRDGTLGSASTRDRVYAVCKPSIGKAWKHRAFDLGDDVVVTVRWGLELRKHLNESQLKAVQQLFLEWNDDCALAYRTHLAIALAEDSVSRTVFLFHHPSEIRSKRGGNKAGDIMTSPALANPPSIIMLWSLLRAAGKGDPDFIETASADYVFALIQMELFSDSWPTRSFLGTIEEVATGVVPSGSTAIEIPQDAAVQPDRLPVQGEANPDSDEEGADD